MTPNLLGLLLVFLYMYNNLESSKFQTPNSKQYLIAQILNFKSESQHYLRFVYLNLVLGYLGFGAYRV